MKAVINWITQKSIAPGSVDLVCLPEMVFTGRSRTPLSVKPREWSHTSTSGYVFSNADSIKPFLEDPITGPTSRFCFELATRLRCHVVAGYPERLPEEEIAPGVDEWGNDITRVGANSAILFAPDGECVGRYRKTNLFETDTTWAKPGESLQSSPSRMLYDRCPSLITLGSVGTGFATFRLPPPLNSVSLGICMDLNVQKPSEWKSIEGPYEIASYCVAENSNLLILLNAWLESPEDIGEEHAWTTMNFWAHRLRPLWEQREGVSPNDQRGINVVVCNRTGNENGESNASNPCGGTGVV